MKLGHYNDALQAFEKCMKLKSDYAPAWNNKGLALVHLSRLPESLEAFERAISIKHNFVEAWNNKGNVLLDFGQFPKALEAFDQTISNDQKNSPYRYNRARAYALLGNREKSLEDLSIALALLGRKWSDMAKKDPAFRSMHNDEDFRRLVA